MRGVTMRAKTSAGPPAANGTITVIGRDGYVCAEASSALAKNALKPIAKALIRMAASPPRLCGTVARVAEGVKAVPVRHRSGLLPPLWPPWGARMRQTGLFFGANP